MTIGTKLTKLEQELWDSIWAARFYSVYTTSDGQLTDSAVYLSRSEVKKIDTKPYQLALAKLEERRWITTYGYGVWITTDGYAAMGTTAAQVYVDKVRAELDSEIDHKARLAETDRMPTYIDEYRIRFMQDLYLNTRMPEERTHYAWRPWVFNADFVRMMERERIHDNHVNYEERIQMCEINLAYAEIKFARGLIA
jgi:hypothetical protein